MVIVHRNLITGCPTGGLNDPHKEIEVVTEYIPKKEKFRIKLPEYMHERLNGVEYVYGSTASDCLDTMRKTWEQYSATFMRAREIKKYIRYNNNTQIGPSQGILSHEIHINFDWNVVYLCQMNSDKPNEKGWVECTKDGAITDSRKLIYRIDPTKLSHSNNYIEWTPERELFFKQMIEEFNRLKRKMIDFFHPSNRKEMIAQIESTNGFLLTAPEPTANENKTTNHNEAKK